MEKREIAKMYGHLITELCRKMFIDEKKAEKVALQIYDAMDDKLDNQPREFEMHRWMFQIAVDAIKEHMDDGPGFPPLLHKTPNIECVPSDSHMIESEDLIPIVCNNCNKDILSTVKSDDRLLLILRDLCKLQYPDIADFVGGDQHKLRRKLSKLRRKLNSFYDRNCPLYNMNSSCRCGLDERIDEIGIAIEFKDNRRNSHKVNILYETAFMFDKVNYWKRFL